MLTHVGTLFGSDAEVGGGLAVIQTEAFLPDDNDGSYTYTWTSAPSSGNLLVAGVWRYVPNANEGWDLPPTGWNVVQEENDNGSSPNLQIGLLWRAADGSATDNLSVTNEGDSSERMHIACFAEISGANTTSPIDVSELLSSGTGTGTTVSFSGVTTTATDTVLVAYCGFDDNDQGTAGTFSNSFIKQEEGDQSFGHDIGQALAIRIVSSTGTYATTWTPSSSPGADQYKGVLAAFKAA
jgi:hypothetical protein